MQKKVPMRMCLGCNEKMPKKELVRVVKTPEGEITLDTTGRMNGRGCYVCKKAECMEAVVKQKKLARSFEMNVPAEVYDSLYEEFNELIISNGGNAVE